MTLIFAHRGYSAAAPENTMLSFQLAEEASADGIELDVQLTRDGCLAVIHDEKLDRTTNGKGYVKDWLWEEIRQLHASYKFPSLVHPPGIPSLQQVFEWMRGNGLLCNIELKNNRFPYQGMEEKVIRLIRRYRYEERVIISSFNHYSLTKVHRLAPDLETAALYSSRLYMPWKYAAAIQAKAIHPNVRTVTKKMIASSLASGIHVRPYTINKEKQMKWLIAHQCSGFFTDDPQKAVRIRQQAPSHFPTS
ncbi:glycerophosphodiester phosphodiesterase [Bacillus xiapuensis]|uniref:glycerophosphodiester phosphodiesterase n=1 Tax=Bacillus xiapuensis TaxID=2014075 RepID=UPI000C24FF3E|nr:glycerophosphodiester phosphodiesterase [Bacillus xiapuensis]